MGEAKRRLRDSAERETLDGGEPSDDRIVLMLDIFDARQEWDSLRVIAMTEVYKRAHQRPTPICSACDYEFGYGEPPSALYCTRPMFPKGDAFTSISGAICPRCASRPPDELIAAIVSYLSEGKPDLTIIDGGTA